MNCPMDGTELAPSRRAGVTVHACPVCRGVWLARRDAERLVERVLSECQPPPADRPPRFGHDDDRPMHRRHHVSLREIFDVE